MTGFFTFRREGLDHALFAESARLGAWVWMIGRAAWKQTPFDVKGKIITLERGQLCVSRQQLADAWKWSPSAVERFLTRLETEQMIGRATGQGRTIITILNYSKYQDREPEAGQATGQATGHKSDSHRTTKEQGNKETSTTYPDGYVADDGESDPIKVVFETGHSILEAAGHTDHARRGRVIGNWRKQYGDDDRLIDALSRCIAVQPQEPISWINAQANPRRPSGDMPRTQTLPDLYPRGQNDEPTNPFYAATLERKARRAAGELRDADPSTDRGERTALLAGSSDRPR